MPAGSYAQTRRASSSARAASRPLARVRWDKLGRIAMLLVLVALVYLYASAGMKMLSTLHQSHRDSAAVASMERKHRALLSEHNVLSNQSALEREARALGMMRAGEQPYVMSNLPQN